VKPELVADDKVLRLLAISGRALERSEIAEALGWTKQRAAAVLLRLVQGERVAVTPGERDRTTPLGGRPPALYSLPGMEPAKPGAEKGPYFRALTVVVTPSGREARVIAMKPGGYCEIEYLVVRLGHEARTTIKARLLREFQAGREKPQPVRIAPSAELAQQVEDATSETV
jgi:hypothetical protein